MCRAGFTDLSPADFSAVRLVVLSHLHTLAQGVIIAGTFKRAAQGWNVLLLLLLLMIFIIVANTL